MINNNCSLLDRCHGITRNLLDSTLTGIIYIYIYIDK
jgi:hypothetical protein